jgi:hypothetical protein
MKTKYLLPHSLKFPGWIILGVGIIFGLYTLLLMNYLHYLVDIIYLLFNMNNSNYYDDFKNLHCDYFFDDLAGCLIIIGSLFITLSKEKIDDEYIMNVRYQSLFWALIVNSILLIIAIFTFYGREFFLVMNINIVSLLILFLIKYKLALKRGY